MPMKLLKIIIFVFAIYFIRRFIQMYSVMKEIQKKQAQDAAEALRQTQKPVQGTTVVDADYKVID